MKSVPYTRLLTLHVPEHRHDFLLFGDPAHIRRIHTEDSGSRAVARYFAPDSLFGYARQDLNEYGILRWYTYFFRATHPGESAHITAGAVEPAAECLVACTDKKTSLAAKHYLETLEKFGLDPSKTLELHRRADPYLSVGVNPEDVVAEYASGYRLPSS